MLRVVHYLVGNTAVEGGGLFGRLDVRWIRSICQEKSERNYGIQNIALRFALHTKIAQAWMWESYAVVTQQK